MTVFSPRPIRPKPGQTTTSYGLSPYYQQYSHHSSPYCEYSMCPQGNYLRQRLYHKIVGRPGSSFAPPRRQARVLSKQECLPYPVTPSYDVDEERSLTPEVSIIEDDSSIGCSTDDDEQLYQHQQEPRSYKVSFDTQVAVYEIPHRDSYQDKSAIWNNQREIKRNATRNTVEYTYERFNWRMAVEEGQFLRLPSGQLIHPAHVGKEQHDFLREQYRYRQREHRHRQLKLLQTVHDLAFEA